MNPFPQSFWVVAQRLCAGHYPGDRNPEMKDRKLRGLLQCGIRRVISLMEPQETGYRGEPFDPYQGCLAELARTSGVQVECCNLPIPDTSVPTPAGMQVILDTLHQAVSDAIPTYVHCWGGHGRTSTVVACYLIRQHGWSPQQAVRQIEAWRRDLPKNHSPFTAEQAGFILDWPDVLAG